MEIWEASDQLGGLANGFKGKGWQWRLEKYYHHIFANDKEIINLAKEVGAPAVFFQPKTSTYRQGQISELDSPAALMKHPQLGLWGKLRMGAGLAVLKLSPMGLHKVWEKYRAVEILPLLLGKEGYEKVWLPLLKAKFGRTAGQVNMAWFWARVAKRTKALGYFKGGFEALAEAMATSVAKKGGRIRMNMQVKEIKAGKDGVTVNGQKFDKVLITTPAKIAEKISAGAVKWPKIDYQWAQTLVLELKRSLMEVYWLNILEEDWPFLVAVEQTRMIPKKHYNGKTIVYIGNYLEEGDERLQMDEKQLLEVFLPYLKKINPGISKSWITGKWKFQAPYAQPVFPTGYSKKLPGVKTKMRGVYAANMSMVYPYDRGTNYAVDIGQRAAKIMMEEQP